MAVVARVRAAAMAGGDRTRTLSRRRAQLLLADVEAVGCGWDVVECAHASMPRPRDTGTSLSRAVLCTRLNLDESGLTVSEVFIGARFLKPSVKSESESREE
eukprot:scaffold145003_cov72-Phaeocystis_antarctica.AAC.1